MARGIWKGHISFGLVTIPVSLVSGESKKQQLDFDMLDKRDHAHVGYQKINKKTGEVIEQDDIVKGLKLENGKYAIFEQEELAKLKIKGTQSIDIEQFVGRDEIDPVYFKKFYYLEPTKGGDKTYVLLRETLKKTQKFAVGLIVMHTKQQLVAIGATDDVLILHALHFADEIKNTSDLEVPASGTKGVKVSPKEISMAEKLVEELTEKWKPTGYKDTYFKDVKAAIQDRGRKKVRAEDEVAENEDASDEAVSKVLDLMPLLEKSLKAKGKGTGKGHGSRRSA